MCSHLDPLGVLVSGLAVTAAVLCSGVRIASAAVVAIAEPALQAGFAVAVVLAHPETVFVLVPVVVDWHYPSGLGIHV